MKKKLFKNMYIGNSSFDELNILTSFYESKQILTIAKKESPQKKKKPTNGMKILLPEVEFLCGKSVASLVFDISIFVRNLGSFKLRIH